MLLCYGCLRLPHELLHRVHHGVLILLHLPDLCYGAIVLLSQHPHGLRYPLHVQLRRLGLRIRLLSGGLSVGRCVCGRRLTKWPLLLRSGCGVKLRSGDLLPGSQL